MSTMATMKDNNMVTTMQQGWLRRYNQQFERKEQGKRQNDVDMEVQRQGWHDIRLQEQGIRPFREPKEVEVGEQRIRRRRRR